MFGLSSMISPKAGLNIVKNSLAETLKTEIGNFDIIYKHEKKVIDFRIFNYTDPSGIFHEKILMKYADSAKLCGIIENMLKEKLKKTDVINYAVISYAEMNCKLYLIREGEKKMIEYKL